MQCCAAGRATCRNQQTPQVWMEGSGMGVDCFVLVKDTPYFEDSGLTIIILALIVGFVLILLAIIYCYTLLITFLWKALVIKLICYCLISLATTVRISESVCFIVIHHYLKATWSYISNCMCMVVFVFCFFSRRCHGWAAGRNSSGVGEDGQSWVSGHGAKDKDRKAKNYIWIS